MDGGAWWAAVHGIARGQIQLSDFTFTFHFHALEKEMATLSSVLAWRIPGMGEPGGLPSMGSHRVRHDWSDLAASFENEILKRTQYWGEQLEETYPLIAYCQFIHSLTHFPDRGTTFILLEYPSHDSLYEWCLQQVGTEQPVQLCVELGSFQ